MRRMPLKELAPNARPRKKGETFITNAKMSVPENGFAQNSDMTVHGYSQQLAQQRLIGSQMEEQHLLQLEQHFAHPSHMALQPLPIICREKSGSESRIVSVKNDERIMELALPRMASRISSCKASLPCRRFVSLGFNYW